MPTERGTLSEVRTKARGGNCAACGCAGAVLTGGGTSGTATASIGAECGCSIGGMAVMAVLEAATALVI